MLLPPRDRIRLSAAMFARADGLAKLGFKPADALHLAAAESATVDVFLTCDDRLLRRASRMRTRLRVLVANPLNWLKEITAVRLKVE